MLLHNNTSYDKDSMEIGEFSLGEILEAILFEKKFQKDEYGFLYKFIDSESYGFKCFAFKSKEDFVNALDPINEMSLRVDSLTAQGKIAFKDHIIKVFGEEALVDISRMYNLVSDWYDAVSNEDLVEGFQKQEEIENTIKSILESDSTLDEFMGSIGSGSEIEYWNKIAEEKKGSVLSYLQIKCPELAHRIENSIN